MRLTSGAVQCRVLSSLVEAWRSTQAQLTRREIVEMSMSCVGSVTGRLVAAISEDGDSACLRLWFRRSVS